MENINVMEILLNEFMDDPLMKYIKLYNLEGDLYTDKILSLHPMDTYGTVEAARILDRSDSTIRNYLRTELYDYVQPERIGKFYRLDYKSIFKLHMIFLLVEKANKSVADVANYCGVLPSITIQNMKNESNEVDISGYREHKNELELIQRMIIFQQVRQKEWEDYQELWIELEKMEKELREKENKLHEIRNEINSLEHDKKYIRLEQQNKRLEEKNIRILDYSLKQTLSKKKESKGFFSFFKKSDENENEVDIDNVLKTAIENANKKDESINNLNEIKEIDKIIEKKKKEKENIMNEIKLCLENIKKHESEIQKRKAELDMLEEKFRHHYGLDDMKIQQFKQLLLKDEDNND